MIDTQCAVGIVDAMLEDLVLPVKLVILEGKSKIKTFNVLPFCVASWKKEKTIWSRNGHKIFQSQPIRTYNIQNLQFSNIILNIFGEMNDLVWLVRVIENNISFVMKRTYLILSYYLISFMGRRKLFGHESD